MELAGKIALITGAARRVGAAIAREMRAAGASVAVHYRTSATPAAELVAELNQWPSPQPEPPEGAASHHASPDTPSAATPGGGCIAVQADLADPVAWPRLIQEVVARYGRLDVLVNNAAVFPTGGRDNLAHFDLEAWERILRINLTAPAALAHHAAAVLRRDGGGCIVNLCDISAERPWRDHLAYCASKAGLVNLTRNLARSLAPTVRVVGIAPGIAAFPPEYDEDFRERLIAKVPLKRAGTPEDLAGVVRCLVERGDYLTGQVVAVDGGRSLV